MGECEEDEAGDGRVPPEECLMRTARARLFTYSSQNRVRLVIRYTAFVPGEVYVDYKLSGGKGSLRLGTAHQRFAKSGLLRVNERLTEGEMDKVRCRQALHRPHDDPRGAALLPPLRHQAPDDPAHDPQPGRLVPVRLDLRQLAPRPRRATRSRQ